MESNLLSGTLLDNLETDRWCRERKVINLLSVVSNDPESLLKVMLSDGRLERDHVGDICVPSVCWLKHSLTLESGKQVTNDINHNGYPTAWDAKPSLLDSLISVFYAPVTRNKTRMENITIRQVCKLIQSSKFKERTERLRTIPRDTNTNKKANRKFKQDKFVYACFSGTFSYHRDASLIQHSHLICIDLDHLDNDLLRVQAIVNADPFTIISFVSPNGDGLKIICEVDPNKYTQEQWYSGLSKRLAQLCDLPTQKVDESCSNVSRACFLPCDPSLYINPNA